MKFCVTNESDTDVYLQVGSQQYTIKANDRDVQIDSCGKRFFYVRRCEPIALPEYKKLLSAELLGVLSLVFGKPATYELDVSSVYRFSEDADAADLTIVRMEKPSLANLRSYYDIICARSARLKLWDVTYRVENEAALRQIHDKCRRTARFWTYFLIELVFTLLAMAVTYPLLIALYLQTHSALLIALMVLIPVLVLSVLALIVILPLHFIFKHSDSGFYRAMEQQEIVNAVFSQNRK